MVSHRANRLTRTRPPAPAWWAMPTIRRTVTSSWSASARDGLRRTKARIVPPGSQVRVNAYRYRRSRENSAVPTTRPVSGWGPDDPTRPAVRRPCHRSSPRGGRGGSRYARSMCRNITVLRGLEPAATPEEIEAAARQYVRKVSGVQKTSADTEAAFERAVVLVTDATAALLAELPPRRRPPPSEPPLRRLARR